MLPANNSVIRILLVDDDEEDYLIISSMLKKLTLDYYNLHWVSAIDEARDEIGAGGYDAYLVDYRLGAHNGLELLAAFNLTRRPEPFIILTGIGDDAVEHAAVHMGVSDYLVKGTFDAELLGRVIRYSIQRKQAESQRIQELIEINRSKEEFIALTSHQLRTPATAVKQYLGMVLQGFLGPVDERQRDFLEKAYENNERQINTVNDILKVSRLDLKKIELRKQPAQVSKLMKSIVEDLRSVVSQRHQSVRLKLPVKEPAIEIDAEHVQMAIGNIVDNASKYSPNDTTITISVAANSRRREVTIAIADQGVGIAKADIEKLFKKFSRIDNPLSVAVGGNGLGLYWSKEIIELHGGSLAVASRVGEGTTFTVGLPYKMAIQPDQD